MATDDDQRVTEQELRHMLIELGKLAADPAVSIGRLLETLQEIAKMQLTRAR